MCFQLTCGWDRWGPEGWGARRVGGPTQKKWGPEGWGPEGWGFEKWGPEGWGPEGRAFDFGSPKISRFFPLLRDKSVVVYVSRSHRSRVGVSGRSFFFPTARLPRDSPARSGLSGERWGTPPPIPIPTFPTGRPALSNLLACRGLPAGDPLATSHLTLATDTCPTHRGSPAWPLGPPCHSACRGLPGLAPLGAPWPTHLPTDPPPRPPRVVSTCTTPFFCG